MKKDSTILKIAKNVLTSESESLILASNNLNLDFEYAVNSIIESEGKLIITGIGKSAHIANKIVATLNSTGTQAVFLHAAEAIHGDLGIISEKDVILCISKSGNSPEIKCLLPIFKSFGNILIGMTANLNSALATESNYVLNCSVKEESCPNNIAPTNSTTVQLALGDALAVSLMKLKKFSSENFAKFHPGGSLGKNLLLKATDVLNKNLKPQVSKNASINEVIYEISNKRLGATAVIENNQIIGMITDGDLRRMLENQLNISNLKAEDIMTKKPITTNKDQLLSCVLSILETKKISQIPVIDNKDYLGIIHIHDILKEGITT